MADTETIRALAQAIAANANAIARNPNDWSDSIQSRISLIAEDLQRLRREVDRNSGGDR